MKNIGITLTLALTICIGTCFFVPMTVLALNADIQVLYNENPISFDSAPQIIDGRTMVPMRGIFEALNAEIAWDPYTQTVSALADGDIITLTVGSPFININNIQETMDISPLILDGHTMVPVRYVAKATGHLVEWNHDLRIVIIFSDGFEAERNEQISTHEENYLEPIPKHPISATELDAWIRKYKRDGGANDFELEVMRLVNIERASVSMNPLKPNETLMMAARFKAQNMYYLNYFSHTNPIYGNFYVIPKEIFAFTSEHLGENLGIGQTSPAQIVRDWMNAPGHRDNILNDNYTDIGIGFYNNRWGQFFGSEQQ